MTNKEKIWEATHLSASFPCIVYADGTNDYNQQLYTAPSQQQQSSPFHVTEQPWLEYEMIAYVKW